MYIPLLQREAEVEVEESGLRHSSRCTLPLVRHAASPALVSTGGSGCEGAHRAVAAILTVARCRAASLLKGKQTNMCSLNSCSGPLFFFLFLAVLKEAYVLLSLKPGVFCFEDFQFQ